MKKILPLILLSLLLFACGAKKENEPRRHMFLSNEKLFEFNNLRIYQVMVESFIDGDPERNYDTGYGPSHHKGDLKGITKALPYIKSLGVNAIWLTPIFDSEKGNGGNPRLDATGYFPRNYFKVDPKFGTLEDAKEMVSKAHELGLYVIMDGVFGHSKGNVPPSPKGNKVYGDPAHHSFPESLEFFREVALWWINELEIDGWRLDQAYQVPTYCWKVIREDVEKLCAERKAAGKKWGTLGYMVAEIWNSEFVISEKGYGTVDTAGLFSAFDFPMRYRIVQALAVEENGHGKTPAWILENGYATHKVYPEFAIPNLMLGNHDLVRFGDLLERAGYGGRDAEEYWQRHKCAFTFMATYTGPITIYYGDEIGYDHPNYYKLLNRTTDSCIVKNLCDDHVSRTSGKISGFDEKEKDLQDFLRKMLKLREEYPALSQGERINILSNEIFHADLKTFKGEKLLIIINTTGSPAEFVIKAEQIPGKKLRDILSGSEISATDGEFCGNLDKLSGAFYKIIN